MTFHPSDHDVSLSEEEFRLLRDFIHERFGIYFENNQRASLRARLVGRLASLDLVSFEEYYQYLRFGPQRAEELQRMVSHLTNNETYFFREAAQLQVFAEHVLRAIKERKLMSEAPDSLRGRARGGSGGHGVPPGSMSEAPDSLRRRADAPRRLRLLSAGCSSGEEAHTLAMIVYDSGQFFWNWDVQIVGMDVDRAALEKARRAVYHHN